MTVTTWIIIGVIALVIIAALIIAFGLKRANQKQVSFEPKDELEQKKPDSGNYQAKGGFNFTSGGGVTQEEAQAAAAPATDKDKPTQTEKAPATGAQAEDKPEAQPATQPTQTPDVDRPTEDKTTPQLEPEAETAGEDEDAQQTPEAPQTVPSQQTPQAPKSEPAPAPVPEPTQQSESTSDVEQDSEARPAEEASTDVPEETRAEDQPEEAPQPEVQREEIAPVAGRLGKLRGRMSKSQNVIGKGVLGILSAGDLDDDAWEEIEDTLLMADLGAPATMKVVDDLRERIAVNGVGSEHEARQMLRSALIDACKPELDRSIKAMPYEGKPGVIMVAGVNGTGKTTTTGKLSRVLIGMGKTVVLGAADTFRAAAADQLETWGRRVGAETVRGKEGADPASVAFDAVAKGTDEGVDVVVIDTAGRLHTSVGLMDQLGKVKRVAEKRAKIDEVLLVLDATVGQNGLAQARVFRDVVDITGVVLTKLDGTAKGGIVFQVQEELGVPVKLVGLGEGADDLAPFEVESFVDALLG